jgi:hypothetical protein
LSLHWPAKLLHSQGVTLRFDITASVWQSFSEPVLFGWVIRLSSRLQNFNMWYNYFGKSSKNKVDIFVLRNSSPIFSKMRVHVLTCQKMMRLAILNPLIPRTPNIGRETSEK